MKAKILIICLMFYSFLFCSYSVVEFGVEQQLFLDGHHFLSVIMIDDVCAIRAHPGNDINGWGSTLYLQAFLPGAILGHTVLNDIEALTEGVTMSFTGLISYGSTGNWGEWNSELFFSYAASQKVVNGSGTYNIQLSEPLSGVSGDLNLVKIASNYLHDVPLLDPPYFGDTGDMQYADVNGAGAGFPFTWNPVENPGYFPDYATDSLSIDVSGQYNNVDTSDSTGISIEPAWKPSLKFTLDASDSAEMIFGAIYDLEHATDFWSDNIGITPLILHDTEQTEFNFAVNFESTTDEPEVSVTEDIESDQIEFTIFPNPFILSGKNARNDLTIHINFFDRNPQENVLLGIYNIKGQAIKDSITLDPSENEFIINSDCFQQPGIYFIQLKTSEIKVVRKLTVLR